MGLTVPGHETFYVHPTFLYESLWNVIGFLALHFWTKRHRRRFDGEVFLLYLAWYGLGRMLIESLRTDSLWLVPGAIRISQLLAAVTLAVSVVLLIVLGRKKNRLLWAETRPKEDPAPPVEHTEETKDGSAEEASQEPAEEETEEPEEEPDEGSREGPEENNKND